jgi:exonuclease VII small subunit
MAKKNRQQQQRPPAVPTPFEEARDELFQHVMRCGVVGAELEDQGAWFNDTMQYLSERFPELSEAQMAELRQLGERFAQPPKKSGNAASAA